MVSKNKDMLLSIGVFITLIISFIFMLCFFVPSVLAVSSNQITDAEDWRGNSPIYYTCLTLSSIVYVLPLLLQYLVAKSAWSSKELQPRQKYVTISNVIFICLIVSFIILSLVAWYRTRSIFIPNPSSHGGASFPIFRKSLSALTTDLIIPITLTVVGIILSIAQYFQLRSSPAKDKPVTPK